MVLQFKNKRVLKNGAIGAYVLQKDKSYKWRIIKGPSKKSGGSFALTDMSIEQMKKASAIRRTRIKRENRYIRNGLLDEHSHLDKIKEYFDNYKNIVQDDESILGHRFLNNDPVIGDDHKYLDIITGSLFFKIGRFPFEDSYNLQNKVVNWSLYKCMYDNAVWLATDINRATEYISVKYSFLTVFKIKASLQVLIIQNSTDIIDGICERAWTNHTTDTFNNQISKEFKHIIDLFNRISRDNNDIREENPFLLIIKYAFGLNMTVEKQLLITRKLKEKVQEISRNNNKRKWNYGYAVTPGLEDTSVPGWCTKILSKRYTGRNRTKRSQRLSFYRFDQTILYILCLVGIPGYYFKEDEENKSCFLDSGTELAMSSPVTHTNIMYEKKFSEGEVDEIKRTKLKKIDQN